MTAHGSHGLLQNVMWKMICFGCCGAAVLSAACMPANRDINDMVFVSVEVVNSAQQVKDSRLSPESQTNAESSKRVAALKIRFSSHTNLMEFARRKDFNISSEVYVCNSRDAHVVRVGGGYVSWMGFDVNPHMQSIPGYSEPALSKGELIYDVYASVRRDEVKTGPFSSPEFDLLKSPQALCLQLRGGGMVIGSFISNTIVVPKNRLSQALKRIE